MFVAIEGPNGVGKSTIVSEITTSLEARLEREVLATREPSTSQLGRAIRALESELTGYALAFACAADRLHHVAAEIEPALGRGAVVLTDRYVPSSLVLQRLDGLSLTEIWRMNETARRPNLTLYLEDAPDLISQRLNERPARSRLELAGGPQRELDLYADARAFLDARGWHQAVIQGHGRQANEIALEIYGIIERSA